MDPATETPMEPQTSGITEQYPQPTPFSTRAANVFAAPSELYNEVAVQPVQTSSWLIPLLLTIILTITVSFAVFNNPTLQSQVADQQAQAMEKKVADGSMTREQADQARQFMESGSGFMMAIGMVTASVVAGLAFIAIPLILWAGAKIILKFNGRYQKVLEMYGLATLISLLGMIVAIMMMYGLNSLYANPSGTLLLMDSYDPANMTHNILASLNIFTLWMVAVVGLGLAKISGKPVGLGMGLAFGLWAVWTVIAATLGLGMM